MAIAFDTHAARGAPLRRALRPRALTRGDTILALVPVSTTQGRRAGDRRRRSPSQEATPAPAEPAAATTEAQEGAPPSERRAEPEAPPRRSPRRARPQEAGHGRRRAAARSPATSPRQPPSDGDGAKRTREGGERQSRRGSQRAGRKRRRRPPQRRAPLPAAKRELLITVDVGEQRVALLEDDRVAEVYLERPERRSIAGQHLPRHRRQRAARHGGGVRRDRPREERVPLRRRDRRPRARGQAARQEDPGPDPARPADPRPGGQGPDEDEGRAADDGDLAARPLPRLRPERRGARRLAPARGRGARSG